MRKIMICLGVVALLAFCGLLPGKSRDVASLLPVETLLVSRQNGTVCIAANETLLGRGGSWEAAMDALEQSAPGTLFLGTVNAVVFTENATALLPAAIRETQLRPAAQVCVTANENTPADVPAMTSFLNAHSGGITLANLRTSVAQQQSIPVPRLFCAGGRYRFGQAL